MIHVPPTSPSSLSPATIQRYLQATFIYPDHRNIIDISVRVFVDCYMYVVIYCEMQMTFYETNPDSSCLHFSRQKRLLETQNVEFNSFRTIKISDLELLSSSQSHLDFFGQQREQSEFLQL